jgi:hypothetical protein
LLQSQASAEKQTTYENYMEQLIPLALPFAIIVVITTVCLGLVQIVCSPLPPIVSDSLDDAEFQPRDGRAERQSASQNLA